MLKVLSILLVVIFAAACDQTPDVSSHGDRVVPRDSQRDEKSDQSKAQSLAVLSLQGEPIVGATILIGTALGDPFSGNLLVTDESGQAAIPAEWLAAAPITIQAAGHISVTYQNQMPVPQNFSLRPYLTQQQSYRVAGQLKGFGDLPRDGKIDFGMVVPSLTRQDLFQLDVTRFLSNEMDTITVVGQDVDVPGNLVLPTQRERYGLIPINFDKNNYAIQFGEGGLQTATTLHGQFDVSDVIGKVRAKAPYYELIKAFKMVGGNINSLELSSPDTSVNLSVGELRFESRINVQAPPVHNDEIVLAVGIVEKQGVILPTGITALESEAKGQLPTTQKWGDLSLVTVRKHKADFDQEPQPDRDPDLLFTLSATVLPIIKSTMNPQNLELVEQPELVRPTHLKITPPATLSEIEAAATYASLSLIEEVGQGAGAVEKKTTLWESYTEGWATEVALPEPADALLEAGRTYRWEVSFIGQPQGQSANLGPQVLDQATHVSLSAKSF